MAVTTHAGCSSRDMDEAARKEYWATLALRHSKGLGARSLVKLLRTFGSAYGAVEARSRWGAAGLGPAGRDFAAGAWRTEARKEWDSARNLAARILLWADPAYPSLLRQLPDAPALLYCRGDGSLLRAPAFAVVGSRRATAQGKAVAAYMARCLSACGVTIVSGMAQGIDCVAHEAALGRVGRSIGVLGTGIDVRYPACNAGVFAAMEREGLLVSEFPPGAPPLPTNFPVRNRIISGLALGVLVAEAASRSGSLVTARLALEQNREVYAVPGPALDAHCLGSQDLVRQGARPVFNAEDVLRDLADRLRPYGIGPETLPDGEREALPGLTAAGFAAADVAGGVVSDTDPGAVASGRDKPSDGAAQDKTASAGLASDTGARAVSVPGGAVDNAPAAPPPPEAAVLTPATQAERLLAHLRGHGPLQVDALGLAVGLAPAALNALLIGLEMQGKVRRLPGARYEVRA